ncbi:hypothetical protein K458DRAFT_194526 [Lentithecium fluviatile CBS 122367]|uniref:Uncharacterized protein n=1 Tax=Lentithecium fluviatile CBS 122367 TaxID=1168545 RepID=A0A6G1ICW3_9PLEO|nr:hypothetical protein K458DRAFT_194526 [Lentithecium fluviatile CBS 122367]
MHIHHQPPFPQVHMYLVHCIPTPPSNRSHICVSPSTGSSIPPPTNLHLVSVVQTHHVPPPPTSLKSACAVPFRPPPIAHRLHMRICVSKHAPHRSYTHLPRFSGYNAKAQSATPITGSSPIRSSYKLDLH